MGRHLHRLEVEMICNFRRKKPMTEIEEIIEAVSLVNYQNPI